MYSNRLILFSKAQFGLRKERARISSHLILHFKINLLVKIFYFSRFGNEKLECITPTKFIILNNKDISIHGNLVVVKKEKKTPDSPEKAVKYETLKIEKKYIKRKQEWYIIQLTEGLEENDIVIVELEYTKVRLRDPDVAFIKYRYTTKTSDGEKLEKWLAVTRSGAVMARRLYPCIDQPDSKATFSIIVMHDKNYKSLSNTFEDGNYSHDVAATGWEGERFEETQPLSTFSVGFLIGDLKVKEKIDEMTNRPIRIWAEGAVLDQMDFASDAALQIFQFYMSYFVGAIGVDIVDIAALPNYGYVDKGRYGLMTLDESLLAIRDSSSEIRKIEVALQLCDLFCHQYFSPQTTLEKWNENWVNLGFALYFRIPCLGKIFPQKETSIVNVHLVESFIHVLAVETEIKSRPMMFSDDSTDLMTIFDDSMLTETAYLLVRMMSFFLGHNALYDGVKNYIDGFRYKVLDLDKLWTMFSLGKETSKLLKSEKPITLKDIMDSWISKAGHAHIKLTRDTSKNIVTIEQILPTAEDGKTIDPRIIPLNFVTKSQLAGGSNQEVTAKSWLRSEPLEIQAKNDEWIIHDSRLHVLCRTEYDSISLDLLEKTLLDSSTDEYQIIPVLTRANFVFDLFALAEMNKISYERVFRTMTYLSREDSPLPLIVALHEFDKIRFGLFRTEVYGIFEKYVRKILQPIFSDKLFSKIEELPQDDYETYTFKQTIINASCMYGVEDCIFKSGTLFDHWWATEQPEINNPIPQVLRQTVYSRGTNGHDEVMWDFLWHLYDKNQPGNYDAILNTLAYEVGPDKLYEYLTWSIDAEKIALQDSLTVFKSVGFNMKGYPQMMKFMRENFRKLLKRHAKDRSNVYRYWEILYESTNKQEDLETLENLILEIDVEKELPNLKTRLKDSRWKAEKNIAWLDRNRHDFPLFLTKVLDSLPASPKRKPRRKPELKVQSGGGVNVDEGLNKRKNVGSGNASKVQQTAVH